MLNFWPKGCEFDSVSQQILGERDSALINPSRTIWGCFNHLIDTLASLSVFSCFNYSKSLFHSPFTSSLSVTCTPFPPLILTSTSPPFSFLTAFQKQLAYFHLNFSLSFILNSWSTFLVFSYINSFTFLSNSFTSLSTNNLYSVLLTLISSTFLCIIFLHGFRFLSTACYTIINNYLNQIPLFVYLSHHLTKEYYVKKKNTWKTKIQKILPSIIEQ